jgi:hypothetical protein
MEQVVFSTVPNLLLPPYYTSGKLRRFAQGLLRPSQKLAWNMMQNHIMKQFQLEGCLEPSVPLDKDLFYGGQILESTWNQLINHSSEKGVSSSASKGTEDAAASNSSLWKGLFKKKNKHCSSKNSAQLHAYGSGSMDGRITSSSGSSSSSSSSCYGASAGLSSCSTASTVEVEKPKANIRPLKGEVAAFTQNGIYLRSGDFVEADVVLYCTGYTKSYDYLEGSVKVCVSVLSKEVVCFQHVNLPGFHQLVSALGAGTWLTLQIQQTAC